MAGLRTFQQSFSGGEVSPDLFGRLDDGKYQSGLALCRNFLPRPQGPVDNRPGFAFVREVKNSAKRVRLIPFVYSADQTMIVEAGAGYFRFHTRGATLMNGAVPYEIASPYAEADLPDIHTVQSADVLTLVHPGYAPRELRRLGALAWELRTIVFTPPLAAPSGVSATPSGSDPKYTYSYVVTAVDESGESDVESNPSGEASCSGNLYATGFSVTVAWSAVPGATRYSIYKQTGGLYGYVGRSAGTSFVDDNIAPDLSKTPPLYDDAFDAPGDYPGAVSYFEQRRCFAGTLNQPQKIWMTRSGTESDLGHSVIVRDDDRIAFRVAAREANAIRHIVPLGDLLLLTAAAEWKVTSVNSDAITPSTVSVRPQSYIGASNVQPVVINNTLIFGAARGGHAAELAYSWQSGGFVTADLCLRAAHLFDGFALTDMAYSKAPFPVVWCVSSSGKLLALTYVPEQQIGAWSQHDTDGVFESCAVVAEDGVDALYVAVRRTVAGGERRYIERLALGRFAAPTDAFFVDSGLTYRGAPATVISGLAHLEGKEVAILADGAVHPRRTVSAGSVTLDQAARVVQVGLPIVAELQTLPISAAIDGYGQGRPKNVDQVWLRVYRSSGVFVGPDAARLVEAKQRTDEPYGSAPALKTDEIAVRLAPAWNNAGQVWVRQADPLALTVVSLSAQVALGG